MNKFTKSAIAAVVGFASVASTFATAEAGDWRRNHRRPVIVHHHNNDARGFHAGVPHRGEHGCECGSVMRV